MPQLSYCMLCKLEQECVWYDGNEESSQWLTYFDVIWVFRFSGNITHQTQSLSVDHLHILVGIGWVQRDHQPAVNELPYLPIVHSFGVVLLQCESHRT